MPIIKEQYNLNYERVKKSIIRKIGKGDPFDWPNKEYEELSLDIKSKTNVLISPATLKRIFGKFKTPDKYYPQKATINALFKYAANFENDNKKYQNLYSPKAILVYFIAITLGLSCVFIFYKSPDRNLDYDSTLIIRKVEGTTPSSVFFEYNIPNTASGYYIDFGDGRVSEKLNAEVKKITHWYQYPGVLKAKIMKGSKVVSEEVDIVIPTNGWKALSYYYHTPHEERLFYQVPMEKAISNGVFYPSPVFLNSIGIDTTEVIMMQLANFVKTKTNGDSFYFETRIKKVGSWRGVQCFATFIEIAGTDGSIYLRFNSKGCSIWTAIWLGEKKHVGTNSDLSDFILSIDKWIDISIVNNNKNVEILVDKNPIYKEAYKKSVGNITGISIIFLGNGHIDYVRLYDDKKKLVLGNDF